MAARRGKQRATVAVGHTILPIASHLLHDPARVYEERGAHVVAERDRQAIERNLVRRLQQLGNTVVLQSVGVTPVRPRQSFSEHAEPFDDLCTALECRYRRPALHPIRPRSVT